MLAILALIVRITLACSAGNCSLPECPRCRECVRFCDCDPD